jgi:hypothetical protein
MLISEITGLSKQEVEKADWVEVLNAANSISEYISNDSKTFYNEFVFDHQKYKFTDLTKLSFGEFVDIDSFLGKDEKDRKKELHVLLAMLYREVDEKGKLIDYDSDKVAERAEKFKKLPVKYVNGASTFFLRLEKILQGNFQTSSKNKLMMILKMIWTLGKLIVFLSIGIGFIQLSNLHKKISQKWSR